MRIVIILVIIFFSSDAYSQIGVSAKYLNSNTRGWNDFIENSSEGETFMQNGMEFGLNYWFRLKNQRIEFLPEVIYSKRSQEEFLPQLDINESARMTTIGINTNVQIYPLDFYNDCNCPTFSKDGNVITKGFYWLISPGIAQVSKELMYLNSDISGGEIETLESSSRIITHIGIGAGLDIGIADLFTISPFAVYDLSFGHQWNELAEPLASTGTNELDTNISSLNFGLRLMFRPDYVKQNRGFRR
ncbi:MAG: hypothetical protein KJO29_11420 [Bacteroidia bacterium]|nr:hypothetical protein [Bacteroidia bacterium]